MARHLVAELGVGLFMFTIGLEFSVQSLARIRRAVFAGATPERYKSHYSAAGMGAGNWAASGSTGTRVCRSTWLMTLPRKSLCAQLWPWSSNRPEELVQTTSLDLLRAKAPCPMLVVPRGVASAAPSKRVLLAVDGCPFALGDNAGATHHLLEALGAITMFHVIPDTGPDELAPLVINSVTRTGLFVGLPAVESNTVVNSHAATGILEAAQPTDYDLVVMARRRSFTGSLFHHSVTAEVMRQSKLSVLVLPAQ